MRQINIHLFAVGAGRWICLVLSSIFLLAGIKAYSSMEERKGASVCLTGVLPDKGQAEEIMKREEERELPEDICFQCDLGMQTVKNPVNGKRKEVFASSFLGDISLYEDRLRGLGEEDLEGCIIDEETSYALFGSREGVGGKLLLGDRKYEVRGVVPLEEPMLIIRSEEKELSYTRVYIQSEEASLFLMRNGLTGIRGEELPLKKLSFFLLFLMPLTMLYQLFFIAWKERKEPIWRGLLLCAAVFILTGILFHMEIPREWIPGKWSDFSFWSTKFQEKFQMLKSSMMLPQTVLEAEQKVLFGKTVFYSVISLFLYRKGQKKQV